MESPTKNNDLTDNSNILAPYYETSNEETSNFEISTDETSTEESSNDETDRAKFVSSIKKTIQPESRNLPPFLNKNGKSVGIKNQFVIERELPKYLFEDYGPV